MDARILFVLMLVASGGCITPGRHLQFFDAANTTDEAVSIEYRLEREEARDRFTSVFEREVAVNASSWSRASEFFDNGHYRLTATVTGPNNTTGSSTLHVDFGDVSLHNVDPDKDPRVLQMLWDGTALVISPCGNRGCPGTAGNLTRMVTPSVNP